MAENPSRLLVVLLRAAALASVAAAAAAPSSPSYVILMQHQAKAGQPYPRGMNSKSLQMSVGAAAPVAYQFTLDTGSAIPMVTCKAPQSDANCKARYPNGMPASRNYQLTAASVISDAATCAAAGAGGCLTPGTQRQCFVSEPLTDGTSINIYNGFFVREMLSFRDARTGRTVTFNATIGCALAYIHCSEDSTSSTCYTSATNCPATASAAAAALTGRCPGSGSAIEAGWTFASRAVGGGVPSVLGVPEQAAAAGLITEKVTGTCFQQPQKNLNCASPLTANSYAVLGPALPKGLTPSSLSNTPLIPAVFPKPFPPRGGASNTSTPFTHTLRSIVAGASVATWGGAPVSFSFPSSVSVLWDTGAYGHATVPSPVYSAWLAYFNARLNAATAAASQRGFTITPCPDPAAVCGANLGSGPASCLQIALQMPAADIATVRRLLLAAYPPPINITLQGGAVVRLPSVYPVSLCGGPPAFNITTGVAACSYISEPANGARYFWLAGPFFGNRYVRVNASGPMPGFPRSVGTISWSDPLSSCQF